MHLASVVACVNADGAWEEAERGRLMPALLEQVRGGTGLGQGVDRGVVCAVGQAYRVVWASLCLPDLDAYVGCRRVWRVCVCGGG